MCLPEGTLGDNLVRLDIAEPQGLRLPNGNELGANEQWIPGQSTEGGTPEATIDPPQQGEFVSTPIFE